MPGIESFGVWDDTVKARLSPFLRKTFENEYETLSVPGLVSLVLAETGDDTFLPFMTKSLILRVEEWNAKGAIAGRLKGHGFIAVRLNGHMEMPSFDLGYPGLRTHDLEVRPSLALITILLVKPEFRQAIVNSMNDFEKSNLHEAPPETGLEPPAELFNPNEGPNEVEPAEPIDFDGIDNLIAEAENLVANLNEEE